MQPVWMVQTDERHLGPSPSLNQSVERHKIWQFRLVSLITWPVVIENTSLAQEMCDPSNATGGQFDVF